MPDDIFLTPEEQDERAKQWLKDNGPALAIGIGLGLAGVFGYNQYQENQVIEAEAASAEYTKVINATNESTLSSIDAEVELLKRDYAGSAYAAKAALVRAKQLANSDLNAAFDELQWVVNNSTESGLVHTARIRQAKIKLALGDVDEAATLASPASYDGFESHYLEISADVKRRQNEYQQARDLYQQAIDALGESDVAYRQILTIKMDRLPVQVAEGE